MRVLRAEAAEICFLVLHVWLPVVNRLCSGVLYIQFILVVCFKEILEFTDKQSINEQDSQVQSEQIVTFQTGGDKIVVSKPAISVDKTMLVSAHEDRYHGLLDFLKRPIPLGRYVWTTSDGPRAILGSLNFPEVIWAQTMWAEKLKGFRYFRADLHFQIQVNASPFDVGRLWAFWSPFDAERGNRRPFNTRTNTTGYPGVEVDAGNLMTSELVIPYVSMYSHIDQLLGSQPYGLFRLQVLSQFFSQNEPNANVTVYCWMENVDLSIPTDVQNFGATVGQSGRGRPVHMTEQVERSKGVITEGAQIVGGIAKLLGNVPIIGEVAKPVAWMADATAGVASLLGFSKPSSLQTNCSYYNLPAKGFTHSDGLDQGVKLGAKPDNEIGVDHKVFGTDVDEMNIPYIIGRPNWVQAFNWPISKTPLGAPLFTIPVHAGICGTEDAGTGWTTNHYTPTHMAAVASLFRFWRGSVTFRFTAVKNPYYSGRLVIVFYPGIRFGQVTNYTSFDVAKCYQRVWDIKRDEDIEITIPFQSNLQFLRVQMHDNVRGTEAVDLTTDTITGTLAVYVDNSLRAPASVPDNIWIHVWVHGGADMTFSVPDAQPFVTVGGAPTWLLPTQATPPFSGQMMEVEESFNVNHMEIGIQNPEGSSLLVSKPKDSLLPQLACIGEVHNNLRPLTRRFTQATNVVTLVSGSSLTLDPAWFESFQANQTSMLEYISRFYAFYRGSIRFKVFVGQTFTPDASSGVNTRWAMASSAQLLSTSPINYDSPVNNAAGYGGGRFAHIQSIDLNPILEIECPYYSNVPMQLVSNTYITNLHLRMVYKFNQLTPNSLGPGANYRIFKAGGDDFSFGYLIGAPPLFRTGFM